MLIHFINYIINMLEEKYVRCEDCGVMIKKRGVHSHREACLRRSRSKRIFEWFKYFFEVSPLAFVMVIAILCYFLACLVNQTLDKLEQIFLKIMEGPCERLIDKSVDRALE